MSRRALGAVSLGCLLGLVTFAPACGESARDGDAPALQAGNGNAMAGGGGGGTHAPTGTAGTNGSSGGAGGSSSSGSGSGGSGSSGGGKPSTAGQGAGGNASAAGSANAGAAGASGELVDCDPLKITCKRAAPECPVGQVPRVDDVGNCYGDCVKIDRCVCSTAQQCPDNNQYTCWGKQHCGPYVQ